MVALVNINDNNNSYINVTNDDSSMMTVLWCNNN